MKIDSCWSAAHTRLEDHKTEQEGFQLKAYRSRSTYANGRRRQKTTLIYFKCQNNREKIIWEAVGWRFFKERRGASLFSGALRWGFGGRLGGWPFLRTGRRLALGWGAELGREDAFKQIFQDDHFLRFFFLAWCFNSVYGFSFPSFWGYSFVFPFSSCVSGMGVVGVISSCSLSGNDDDRFWLSLIFPFLFFFGVVWPWPDAFEKHLIFV